MPSLKIKALSSAGDVIRSVCREIRLCFSRTWLIHTKRFNVFEGLAELLLRLHLMPTEHMDDPLPIHQIQAKAFRLPPLAAPQRPLGPMAAVAGTAPPSTLGSRGHIGPIDAQHQDRTAPATRCHRRDTPLDLVARRRDI